jgi:hypothetical protein
MKDRPACPGNMRQEGLFDGARIDPPGLLIPADAVVIEARPGEVIYMVPENNRKPGMRLIDLDGRPRESETAPVRALIDIHGQSQFAGAEITLEIETERDWFYNGGK